MNNTKRGQVWIETVIYLLIGLGVLGLLLTFIKPQIDSSIDKNLIEKSIETLNTIDSTINEIYYTAGNTRTLTLTIKKGNLLINSTDDAIILTIPNSKYEYSELDREINLTGTRISALTTQTREVTTVTLTLDYSQYLNITYNTQETNKEIQNSDSAYTLIINNKGIIENVTNIDLRVAE